MRQTVFAEKVTSGNSETAGVAVAVGAGVALGGSGDGMAVAVGGMAVAVGSTTWVRAGAVAGALALQAEIRTAINAKIIRDFFMEFLFLFQTIL